MEAKLQSELDRMTDTLHETVVAVQTEIDALEVLKRAAVRPLPDTQAPRPAQTGCGFGSYPILVPLWPNRLILPCGLMALLKTVLSAAGAAGSL